MATKKTTPAKTDVAVVAPKKASNIVSIQEALRMQAEATIGKVGAPTGNAIRVTQDKKFNMPDGTSTAEPFDAVIVDFVSRNEFYSGPYDPNAISPPVCFAIGQDPKNMIPSDNSPEKQADACNDCPMNQFGSDGKGKACKNTRYLAVLPPDADADAPMWTLKVSPTALKGFDGYVGGVARTFQLPPIGVVTTVGLNESVTYASLVFGDARPNENVGAHFPRQGEAMAILLTEPDTTPREAPAPAARKQPARKSAPVRR